MKIVILDGYTENPGDLSWGGFEALGELTVYDRTTDHSQIIGRIGDAEAVYTNKTPITRETIDACPKMKYIGVLATGYNVVDVTAAREAGIVVTNIPTYGTAAVSQYAIALLLELCHHVGEHSQCVRDGEWTSSPDWCFWKHPLVELAGKTMGIIGFGRIGQGTGRIAQAFGMKVLAYDTSRNGSLESDTCRYVDLETLFKESDVISLHCPLFPATRGIINKTSLAKMKDGVDVVSTEPIQMDNPLLEAENCIITPHISWAPKESRQRLMDIAVSNLEAYVNGKPVNVVNG